MDIWRWVSQVKRELEDDHPRLAQLIDDLPSLVCDDDHSRVEAVVPEALALARAARQPWVEVFVRHWALQSRVLHRYEAREHLPEAVSLLEFANRDDTQKCPQSVCVTQDLTSCYANTDGPGYVRERLDVAAETLGRIDPSWPCYECISSEYASALSDDERYDEVLRWLEAQTDRAVEAGADNIPRFEEERAMAMVALGRAEDAWALLEHYEVSPVEGTGGEVDAQLTRARVLVALERWDDAKRCLPSYDTIADTPGKYEDYAHAMVALVEAEQESNDSVRARQFRRMLDRAEANGALFLAGQLAALAARLAVGRQAWAMARLCLEDVDRICEQLRKPERVQRFLVEHREAIERAPVPELADDPEAVFDALPDEAEAEVVLEVLEAAAKKFGTTAELSVIHARALAACGLEARAEAVLQAHVDRGEASEAAVVELGRVLMQGRRYDAVRALVEKSMQTEQLRTQGLWLAAGSCHAQDQLDEAAEHLEALLEIEPEADVPLRRLAVIERKRGRHAQSLKYFERLVRKNPPGDHDWDRMTQAALVGNWAGVRASAQRLELPVAEDGDEGVIDVPMGLCQMRFVEQDGAEHDYYAERRSPVTARVVQMAGPRRVEHFEDVVVFDADPLNPQGGDDADGDGDASEDGEDDRWVPIYPVVGVIEANERRTWSLDGVHPGDEAWDALVAGLSALGGEVRVRSDESYVHDDPEDEAKTLPGVFAYACMPRELDPAVLHARLQELTAGWEHPLVWPEIARALPEGAEREREVLRVETVTERYEL